MSETPGYSSSSLKLLGVEKYFDLNLPIKESHPVRTVEELHISKTLRPKTLWSLVFQTRGTQYVTRGIKMNQKTWKMKEGKIIPNERHLLCGCYYSV